MTGLVLLGFIFGFGVVAAAVAISCGVVVAVTYALTVVRQYRKYY